MKNVSNIEITVLISSCDFFSDCWEPMIYSINKYWSDCPFPVYILSNNKEQKDGKVKFLKVGEDRGWADNLLKALHEIDSEYILYLQEDYWLNKNIDTDFIYKQIQHCDKEKIDYLRLSFPFVDRYKINDMYCKAPLGKHKSTLCLQTVVWRKSVLEKLLVSGWTGWNFENKIYTYIQKNNIKINALSLLSRYAEKCFSYPDGTAVRKGRWTVGGYEYLIENGFDYLLNCREVEGKFRDYLNHFREKYPFLKYVGSILIRIMDKFKWNF